MTEAEALRILDRECRPKPKVTQAIELASKLAGRSMQEMEAWEFLRVRRRERESGKWPQIPDEL